MRVPDPEDPKYWYRIPMFYERLPKGKKQPKKWLRRFSIMQYIFDFRKWKTEFQHLIQEFPKEIDSQDYEKGCNASFLMYSYAEIQMWLGKLKEILGEEASEDEGKRTL